MESLIECYFVDVGQGSSNVIDLGDGSAIVIDCGRTSDVLTALLKEINVSSIKALILTHNDIDHIGGVVGLIGRYKNCIDNVYLLLDRTPTSLLELRSIRFLIESAENGEIPEPENLARSGRNLLLYERDSDNGKIKLELLFPSFFSNVSALTLQNPNSTSAILLLSVQDKRIIYSGDADIHSWKAVHRKRNEQPLTCDVLAVPHHGGIIVQQEHSGGPDSLQDINDLYSKVLRARHAIISVGTNNSYEHPNPEHVSALVNGGACVMCTQITKRCINDPRRGSSLLQEFNRLPGAAMLSRGSGCAGTVLARVNASDVEVIHRNHHQAAVDSIRSGIPGPRCRV